MIYVKLMSFTAINYKYYNIKSKIIELSLLFIIILNFINIYFIFYKESLYIYFLSIY